jgi:hypothetical protein
MQRNKSLLLLLHELLQLLLVHVLVQCTVPHIWVSDLFKGLLCRVRIVIAAGISRICRVDGVGRHIRAI